MISLVEANQAWLESLTYQMNNLTYKQQNKFLGGPLGLLKSFATRSAHEIADDAVNIFGVSSTNQPALSISAIPSLSISAIPSLSHKPCFIISALSNPFNYSSIYTNITTRAAVSLRQEWVK